MPELPEVEAVVRTLRPLAKGRRIRCVHVFHPIATKPQSASRVALQAQGRRIRIVNRKGKYVLLVLDRGLLTMHFRLDGQLLWFPNGKELLKLANQAENGVHVDVAFELDKGVLGFADRRHFGRVHVWESANDSPGLRVLGIDPLSPPRRHLEPAGSAPPAQSNCVRSRACLRMLSAPGARLSRPGLVVPGVGKYSSRLWPRGKTLPPLRSADPAHCAGRPVNLLVRALSAIGAFKGYGPIA